VMPWSTSPALALNPPARTAQHLRPPGHLPQRWRLPRGRGSFTRAGTDPNLKEAHHFLILLFKLGEYQHGGVLRKGI